MKSASLMAMVAPALLAFACTTTTTTEPATNGGARAEAGRSATDEDTDADAGAGSRADAGSGSGGSCADEASLEACEQCCGKDNPKGYEAFNDAVFTCVCKAENCASECADTLCTSPDNGMDTACADCFNASRVFKPCVVNLEACKESPDCVAYEQCRLSNCQDKPSK